MEWRSRLGVVVVASCIAAAAPGVVLARGSSVLLDYGAAYLVGGSQRIHRGVDVAMDTGAPAEALVSGEVSFCGRIPADEGGSVLAVTVRTCDGALVTIHPLSESWVSSGDAVAPGDGLGLVAGSGDASVAEPHVHVSLRHGETYLDPSPLLAATEPVPPAPVVSPPLPVTSGAGVPPVSSTRTAPVSTPMSVEPVPEPSPAAEPLVDEVTEVGGSSLPQVSSSPVEPTVTADRVGDAPVYQRYSSPSNVVLPGGAAAARGLLAAIGIGGVVLTGAAVKRTAFVLAEVER